MPAAASLGQRLKGKDCKQQGRSASLNGMGWGIGQDLSLKGTGQTITSRLPQCVSVYIFTYIRTHMSMYVCVFVSLCIYTCAFRCLWSPKKGDFESPEQLKFTGVCKRPSVDVRTQTLFLCKSRSSLNHRNVSNLIACFKNNFLLLVGIFWGVGLVFQFSVNFFILHNVQCINLLNTFGCLSLKVDPIILNFKV